jgi:drug/metabolite transporter (DMT)-like permease
MPIAAIGLLFLSAILHTSWNLLLKKSEEKFVATWWTVTIGGAASLIVLFFIGLPPREIWIFGLLSVLVEGAYFITLSYAYQDHDFSLVYPLARGAAPAFLAVWSLTLLGERPTTGGMLGLALIIGGLLFVGASTLIGSTAKGIHLRGILLALTTALLISIYTAIDGTAIKRAHTIAYAFLVLGLTPLPVTPFVLRRYSWSQVLGAWKTQRLRLLWTGLLGVTSYVLALLAYTLAPLSYSGAIREVSVVMGAFAGWRFLGEKLGQTRVIGAIIIFAGILIIARFG